MDTSPETCSEPNDADRLRAQLTSKEAECDAQATRLAALECELAAISNKLQELDHTQHMDAVARLAGGIAHDFNNLLVVILSNAHLLLDRLGPSHEASPEIEDIIQASERAAEVTQQLLAFGRRQLLHEKIVNLNDVVQDARPMLRQLLGGRIDLCIELQPDLDPVRADPVQLRQALVQLVMNARDAIEQTGTVIIRTYERVDPSLDADLNATSEGRGRRRCCLSIQDDGPGMDETTQSRIFDPFFTTKDVASGGGLGLSMVHGIVMQSGGRIAVCSELGHGSCFEMLFPCVDDNGESMSNALPRLPPSRSVHTRTATILITEDDPSVRRVVETLVRGAGYQVLVAANADEALAISASYSGRIDLLLTDVVMPGMNGIALAKALARKRPDMRILMMSGHANGFLPAGQPPAHAQILDKPFTPDTLLSRIEESLQLAHANAP